MKFSRKSVCKKIKKFLMIIVFSLFLSTSARAQVVLNELMASNSTTISNICGDFADWVEIYNNSAQTVDLAGYRLFETAANWVFPSDPMFVLDPGEYVLLWLDNGNCPIINSVPFAISAGGETITLRDPSFAIVDQVAVPQAVEDESWGLYPNGNSSDLYERMLAPTPLTENQTSTFPPNPDAQFIVINEVVTSNQTGIQDEDGQHGDWIEMYNTAAFPINMLGLRLGDSGKQWMFPDIDIAANGYMLIWADDKNKRDPQAPLHTNFKLDNAGETLTFYNTDGITIEDQEAIPPTAPDNSWARIPNGTGAFEEIVTPTPLQENTDENIQPNPDAVFVRINEILPENESGIRDFENDFEDWIELYNSGTNPVNLENTRLFDGEKVWSFPSYILPPGEYLIVFASSKNLTSPEFHTNFRLSSTGVSGDQVAFLNTDNSLIDITLPYTTPFPIDSSWGRDPNYFGPFRMFDEWSATPGGFNQDSLPPPPNPDAVHIVINEIMSSNSTTLADYQGDYEDWIELYNTSNSVTVDMEDIRLSDGGDTWKFPAGVSMPPNSYLVVFASGKNIFTPELHTNYSISAGGDSVILENVNKDLIDSVLVSPLSPDQTFGRIPNGTGNFTTLSTPTPFGANTDQTDPPNPDAGLIVINEVSSDWQLNTFVDEDGEAHDWIELYNAGSVAVDMENLKLRDTSNVWNFCPGITIQPGQYLTVFASGKNRCTPGQNLHTNFAINNNGNDDISYLNKDNSLVELVDLPFLFPNESYKRNPNGTGPFEVTSDVTPNMNNDGGGIIYGDVNGDGNVNPTDAALVRAAFVGFVTLTPDQVLHADVNEDGNVTPTDAAAINAYFVGFIPGLPI